MNLTLHNNIYNFLFLRYDEIPLESRGVLMNLVDEIMELYLSLNAERKEKFIAYLASLSKTSCSSARPAGRLQEETEERP